MPKAHDTRNVADNTELAKCVYRCFNKLAARCFLACFEMKAAGFTAVFFDGGFSR
jgi:hypothetical protein|tara:strand:+ start:11069 stop:11233 length:165 start_codon:yes stop_codon:yes gene_type:complete